MVYDGFKCNECGLGNPNSLKGFNPSTRTMESNICPYCNNGWPREDMIAVERSEKIYYRTKLSFKFFQDVSRHHFHEKDPIKRKILWELCLLAFNIYSHKHEYGLEEVGTVVE